MSTSTASPDTASAKLAFQLYVAIGIAVYLLMMIAGAVLRAIQATYLNIPANFTYEIMTLHGAGHFSGSSSSPERSFRSSH